MTAGLLRVQFRDRLNSMRKARGWSVQTLADKAALPVGTVNSYCIAGAGSRLPTLANAIALARAFGQSVSVFEDCDDFSPSPDSPDDLQNLAQ